MNAGFNLLAEANQPVITSEPIDAAEKIVSQNGSPTADVNNVGAKAAKPAFNPQLIFIVLMIAVVYLMLFRGPKQKQKKHQQMVSSLAKNDRVRTIGGIIGTIVDIRDDEVILKIDESNNTKIKIIKGAIATTLKDDIEKN